jgi:mannose-6-phosphate isomerase-like protein (cupin superfamily)
MRKPAWSVLVLPLLALPAAVTAQTPMSVGSATYITVEQIQEVNAVPGTDRQIVSRDIGKLNLSVGVIHRGATGGAGGGGGAARPPAQLCGVSDGPASGARGISHDHQTETYVVISGGGTLVTGGQIMSGRRNAPGSNGYELLNGPSCSGNIVGNVQSKDVKVGDVIIIPAGVPHGWSNIPDHVDYLSVRPDPDRVLPDDYINPEITIPFYR